jgi:hypothetical protein
MAGHFLMAHPAKLDCAWVLACDDYLLAARDLTAADCRRGSCDRGKRRCAFEQY